MKRSSLDYSLWLLSKRDRSVGEIRQKMVEKEFGREEIDKTVAFLLDKKFLDDERFARNFVRNQLIMKPQGKYILQQKLRTKKIDKKIIDETLETLSSTDEEGLAEEAAKKFIQKRNIPKEKVYEKVGRHLVSRGFNWEVIKMVLDKILHVNR